MYIYTKSFYYKNIQYHSNPNDIRSNVICIGKLFLFYTLKQNIGFGDFMLPPFFSVFAQA